jgi:DeoR/GlpR family transcriptional regulator of sugar metabolism
MRVRDYNRHEQVLKLLKEETSLDIGQITGKFGISLATARRDLAILEKEGKLLRTFGGARAKDEPSMVVRTFGEKRTVMNEAKLAMARAAVKIDQTRHEINAGQRHHHLDVFTADQKHHAIDDHNPFTGHH